MHRRNSGHGKSRHSFPTADATLAVDFRSLIAIGLTARECEVLGWVAHGKRDADIARILGISVRTVGKHIEHLLAKLHVENRTAAVSVAHDRLRRLRPSGE